MDMPSVTRPHIGGIGHGVIVHFPVHISDAVFTIDLPYPCLYHKKHLLQDLSAVGVLCLGSGV